MSVVSSDKNDSDYDNGCTGEPLQPVADLRGAGTAADLDDNALRLT